MKYWKDQSEPIKAFTRMYAMGFQDEELKPGLEAVNQLIWFNYTQDGPDCSFWVMAKPGQLAVGPGKPQEKPDMTMTLSADDAHLTWLNKLNPVSAIARKKILVKGSATGLLKLAPKLKKVAQIYTKVLTDLGWADKIVM